MTNQRTTEQLTCVAHLKPAVAHKGAVIYTMNGRTECAAFDAKSISFSLHLSEMTGETPTDYDRRTYHDAMCVAHALATLPVADAARIAADLLRTNQERS